MQPDREAVTDTLAEILRTATDTDPGQDPAIQTLLQELEPVIAITAAAACGDSGAAAQLTPLLEELDHHGEDWATLAAILRRIVDGQRDDSMLESLDPAGTAIASHVLARLSQPPDASM